MTLPLLGASVAAAAHAVRRAGHGALDVPVTPDAPTAQRWLRDELAGPEYHQSTSLLERLLGWLGRTFTFTVHPSLPPGVLAVVGVVLVAVVVVVCWRVAGPVRRTARGTAPRAVLDDDTRNAAEIRRAAQDAAARGDWNLAVVERFRALVRSLEERVVLDERPGRTADEAARDAATPMPAQAQPLRDAARLFDEVLYGDHRATAGDHEALARLDADLTATRPLRAAVVDTASLTEAGR